MVDAACWLLRIVPLVATVWACWLLLLIWLDAVARGLAVDVNLRGDAGVAAGAPRLAATVCACWVLLVLLLDALARGLAGGVN